jgi:hypothetical protein
MLADMLAALFLSQSLYDDQIENIDRCESVASFSMRSQAVSGLRSDPARAGETMVTDFIFNV